MNVIKSAMVALMSMALWAPGHFVLAEDLQGKRPFKPDPARGYATAKKLCSGCHIIDYVQTGTVQSGVPSFIYMANKPDQSAQKLAHTMIHPFPPMIDTHLTTHEIKDISAYILALKSRK